MKILTQGIRLILHFATEGEGGAELVDLVSSHYADPTKSLRGAVERANEDVLLVLDLALRPDWIARWLRTPLASGTVRAALAPLQEALDAKGDVFREACLSDLEQARAAGLFELHFDDSELAFAAGQEKVKGLQAMLDRLDVQIKARADALQAYPSLAELLLRKRGDNPLLVRIFNFLLEQAIHADSGLHETLQAVLVQASRHSDLSVDERAELAALRAALGHLPDGLGEALATVRQQIRADMQRMLADARARGTQLGGGLENTVPRLTQIVEDEDERRLVREMLRRYRELPVSERRKLPALPNALGTLNRAIGDTETADALFREAGDPEGIFNRFCNYLENQRWEEAKACVLAAAEMDPARYALFPSDKYDLEEIIGCGGFGVALLCRHRHLGHRVVIKALLARRARGDADLVVREGRILKALSHRAIIRVEDSDYADAEHRRPYLVLEYFPESCSLADWVAREGVLAIGDALILARPIAEALATAHEAKEGILHRDVTPENVLVRHRAETGWEIRLIDFGLAARRDWTARASERYRTTLLGDSPLGKRDYGAPEQMVPNGKIGRFTDVFGFGKTLCFVLFRRPNPTLNDWERIGQHHPFVRLLNRCIHEDPAERPQDFREVLAALDQRDAERTVVVDCDGAGDFASLAEAVAAALPGTRIQVRPGSYRGPIRIEHPMEIVGDGAATDIQLIADDQDVVTFAAARGLLANLLIRQRGSGEYSAVVVLDGRLDIEGCDIGNLGSGSCVLVVDDAELLLTRNRIHDGAAGGVIVTGGARCTLTFNQIYGHSRAALEVQGKAACQARNNELRDGHASAVVLCHQTRTVLAENRIHGNRRYGVIVRDEAELTLECNRIVGNHEAGIAVLHDARCRSTGNDLGGNRGGAWSAEGLPADRLVSDGDSEAPILGRTRSRH